jgi:hypothetical protein
MYGPRSQSERDRETILDVVDGTDIWSEPRDIKPSVYMGDLEVFRQRCPDDCRLVNALSSTETDLICAAMIDKQAALPGGRVPIGRPVGM